MTEEKKQESAVIEYGQDQLPVQKHQANMLAAPIDTSPMGILANAVAQGATPDALTQLMDLAERHERNEARKAYDRAMAKFKKNVPVVEHDMENKQFGSTYSSKTNLVNTVSPFLAKCGLSTTWIFPETEGNLIKVCCVLSHELGHSEKVCFSAPPDDSGKKNPIQQRKSTITYLEIVTFEAVTGVASKASGGDDDGTAAHVDVPALISEEQATELQAMITDAGIEDAKVQRWLDRLAKHFSIRQYTDLHAENFETAKQILTQALNARTEK